MAEKSSIEKSRMQKFDMNTEFQSLTPEQQYYVKKVDMLNKKRFETHKDLLKRGRRTGLFLTAFAIGIYAYTMYAMKQEKFLDEDFNKVPDSVKNK